MSRSDTFDDEPDSPPAPPVRSLPWISSPVLQNTTCDAFLDPRRLLCESSSIIALIPCQSFFIRRSPEDVSRETRPMCEVREVEPDLLENIEDVSLDLCQSDLMSEILSSAEALQVLGDDLNILSPRVESVSLLSSKTKDEEDIDLHINLPPIRKEDPPYSLQLQGDEDFASWSVEGDDGFRDVIEAINRLCDTMSNASSNNNTCSEELSNIYTYRPEAAESVESQSNYQSPISCSEQWNIQPSDNYSNAQAQDISPRNVQFFKLDERTSEELIFAQVSTDSSIDPQTSETSSNLAVIADIGYPTEESSAGDSSSPAIIEDDSSTNQTDILQYSLCSSSLNAEEVGMFLTSDSHLPKPEEIPPPGHVAAMRMKFETFTNVNVNTMRLLKKSDDETF